MFFLIRVAFWLSIVIMLLPTPSPAPGSSTPQLAAADALSAAGAAVADMGQFCSRQPEACVAGSQAAAAFGQKAQASAKMVYDFVTEPRPAEDHAKPAAEKSTPPAPPVRTASGTLTSADMAISWRGPGAARPERQASR